jgi:hypothetical protein
VRPDADAPGYRFKSGVELINVTATVSDINGRFVPGLTQDDFLVYEDDRPVTVTQFSSNACRSASASPSTPAAAWRKQDSGSADGARPPALRPARSAG